jgi:hypothetical protein
VPVDGLAADQRPEPVGIPAARLAFGASLGATAMMGLSSPWQPSSRTTSTTASFLSRNRLLRRYSGRSAVVFSSWFLLVRLHGDQPVGTWLSRARPNRYDVTGTATALYESTTTRFPSGVVSLVVR